MNAFERYLAVFDDQKRKNLDRVPLHVQYIREEFIEKHKSELIKNYSGILYGNLYYDIPMILGFDSVFAPFPSSYKIKSLKIGKKNDKVLRIGENGQLVKHKTAYYEGGYIKTLEILETLESNLKLVDSTNQIQKVIHYYEKLSSKIFPVLMIDGIFDRVWKAMGMIEFSRHYRNSSKLYKKLINFYANLTKVNIEGLINATGNAGKVITILDDVAYKGRTMISPTRWETDFRPTYKEITSLIKDAGMIPQIHTDGNVTDLISSFFSAGFLGLQGFEGGCDPYYINETFPEFVIIGFGDVSYILPYGSTQEIEDHVKYLMNALKENKHFIIGPSTVIFKEIPLTNVKFFIKMCKKVGSY
jgi:hypothetical protein